jgi:hypothetical protein
MRLGRMLRITLAAEAQWQAAREMPTDAEERLLRREAEARARVASNAGRAAAASPRHVSKRGR